MPLAQPNLQSSIRFLVGHEKCDDGEEDDPDVEPEGPVLDIPDVLLYAFLHLPHLFRFTATATHLCPAGDAGEAEMPHHVLVDDLAILLGVCQHVRAWSYDAHVALEHVEELREFIDVGLSYEITEGEFTRVVLGGLYLVGVLVDMHRPEFIASERFAIESRPLLLEEDGAWTLPFDQVGDEGDEGNHDQAYNGTHHDVEQPFDELVEGVGEGFVMIGEHHRLTQLLGLEVQQEIARHPGDIIEMDEVFVTEFYQSHDLLVLVVGEATEQFVGTADVGQGARWGGHIP